MKSPGTLPNRCHPHTCATPGKLLCFCCHRQPFPSGTILLAARGGGQGHEGISAAAGGMLGRTPSHAASNSETLQLGKAAGGINTTRYSSFIYIFFFPFLLLRVFFPQGAVWPRGSKSKTKHGGNTCHHQRNLLDKLPREPYLPRFGCSKDTGRLPHLLGLPRPLGTAQASLFCSYSSEQCARVRYQRGTQAPRNFLPGMRCPEREPLSSQSPASSIAT